MNQNQKQIVAAMKDVPSVYINPRVEFTTKIGGKKYAVRHVARVVFGAEHCSPAIRAYLTGRGFRVTQS